jgi:hypothetical protein
LIWLFLALAKGIYHLVQEHWLYPCPSRCFIIFELLFGFSLLL